MNERSNFHWCIQIIGYFPTELESWMTKKRLNSNCAFLGVIYCYGNVRTQLTNLNFHAQNKAIFQAWNSRLFFAFLRLLRKGQLPLLSFHFEMESVFAVSCCFQIYFYGVENEWTFRYFKLHNALKHMRVRIAMLTSNVDSIQRK